MFIVFAAFWFESSLLAFRLYNVILPLPSFAMLIFGTYAVGLLARQWDLELETDPRQTTLDLLAGSVNKLKMRFSLILIVLRQFRTAAGS